MDEMRSVGLLVLLAGCDLVFPLDDSTDSMPVDRVVLRRAFGGAGNDDARLRIDRPPGIEPGDVIVAVIQGNNSDTLELLSQPVGLNVVAETNALGCPNDSFHVWWLRGVAGDEDVYEFELSSANDHVGAMAAYANASTAALVAQRNPGDLIDDGATSIDFPVSTSTPGSMMWIGGAAGSPWSAQFSSSTKQQQVQQVASFDLASPDGAIPEVRYPLPEAAENFCPAAAQFKIEL